MLRAAQVMVADFGFLQGAEHREKPRCMLELEEFHEAYEANFGEILSGDVRSGLRRGSVGAAVSRDRKNREIFECSCGDVVEGLVSGRETSAAGFVWTDRGAGAQVQ